MFMLYLFYIKNERDKPYPVSTIFLHDVLFSNPLFPPIQENQKHNNKRSYWEGSNLEPHKLTEAKTIRPKKAVEPSGGASAFKIGMEKDFTWKLGIKKRSQKAEQNVWQQKKLKRYGKAQEWGKWQFGRRSEVFKEDNREIVHIH